MRAAHRKARSEGGGWLVSRSRAAEKLFSKQ
jgi:hypothetical protein